MYAIEINIRINAEIINARLVDEVWVDRHALSRGKERRDVESSRRPPVLELVVSTHYETHHKPITHIICMYMQKKRNKKNAKCVYGAGKGYCCSME